MKASLIFIILELAGYNTIAQTTCEQKLKNAKNSIIAIINSGGSNNKINQTATDVMTNMALNCPEMVKEFNKFIQNLDTKGLDGNVQGNYQTNQQRQKNTEELFNKQNNILGGQKGNSNNGGFEPIKNKEDLIAPNDPRLKENRNSIGLGISGKALENERQNEQYRNQAINQIQNGSGGFKPVRNEEDLIAPKLNLDTEVKNFENKLASVPENLKPDLLAKANLILKAETNKQEAARKLANLMKEFERNNGNAMRVMAQKNKQQTIQSDHDKMYRTVDQTKNNTNTEWEQKEKLRDEILKNKDIWEKRLKEGGCSYCHISITRDYTSLVISVYSSKEFIYRILNQYGKKVLRENNEGSIYFTP
jgi:hypothetical protein